VEIRWSLRSLEDLERIHARIELDSPHYASLVIQRLLNSVERLATFPESGRVVPELDEPDISPAPHEVLSSSEQVSSGSHLGGIGIAHGETSAAKQGGDLEGIDFVVLGLAAVDGLHVEGVAEDELDPFASAEVGEPVPGEDALDGHDEILAEGFHGCEEGFRGAPHVLVEKNLSVAIEDAEVHGLGV
jgi:plasmid stabilization system protein ParE